MDEKYNPKNIDKALQRMEQADELSTVARSSTNIFQVFDEIEEEHKLQKQQSSSDLKKEEYINKINLLKEILSKKGTKDEYTRIISIEALIKSINFFNIPPNRKEIIKHNLDWCNKKYKKYLDS